MSAGAAETAARDKDSQGRRELSPLMQVDVAELWGPWQCSVCGRLIPQSRLFTGVYWVCLRRALFQGREGELTVLSPQDSFPRWGSLALNAPIQGTRVYT